MKIARLTIVLILGIALVSGFACGGGEPTATPTPTGTSTPTSTPTPVDWSADGIITPGEYSGTNTYGNYEIHWSSDEQYIYIGMKANTNGWVALGIQPGSRMKDADMIFGFVQDSETTVYDLFSTGDFGPHPPDTDLGGTYDVIESGGREEGGYTTIEFKRLLNTGDEYDNPLQSGVNKIIWSYGSADELSLQHTARGYGEIDL